MARRKSAAGNGASADSGVTLTPEMLRAARKVAMAIGPFGEEEKKVIVRHARSMQRMATKLAEYNTTTKED